MTTSSHDCQVIVKHSLNSNASDLKDKAPDIIPFSNSQVISPVIPIPRSSIIQLTTPACHSTTKLGDASLSKAGSFQAFVVLLRFNSNGDKELLVQLFLTTNSNPRFLLLVSEKLNDGSYRTQLMVVDKEATYGSLTKIEKDEMKEVLGTNQYIVTTSPKTRLLIGDKEYGTLNGQKAVLDSAVTAAKQQPVVRHFVRELAANDNVNISKKTERDQNKVITFVNIEVTVGTGLRV